MYHHRYPLLSQKKSTGRGSLLPGGLIIFFILCGIVIYLLRSGFFTLRNVVVTGDNPQLSGQISSYIKQRFYFPIISPSRAASIILTQFPELTSLSLHPDIFSKTLKASYTPRAGFFLWCKQTDCYLVDSNGVIFAHSDITQASFLVNVQDEYFLDLGPGKKIPPSYIQALLAIDNVLAKKKLKLDHFFIDYAFSIKAFLTSGLELRFTLQKPVDEQLKNFLTLLESFSPDELPKLHYIDLRVRNRIYYK